MKGRKFLHCPDCGKASVYMKLGHDDGWCCRTVGCQFWAYCGGSDTSDLAARARLRDANRGHPLAPILEEVDWNQS